MMNRSNCKNRLLTAIAAASLAAGVVGTAMANNNDEDSWALGNTAVHKLTQKAKALPRYVPPAPPRTPAQTTATDGSQKFVVKPQCYNRKGVGLVCYSAGPTPFMFTQQTVAGKNGPVLATFVRITLPNRKSISFVDEGNETKLVASDESTHVCRQVPVGLASVIGIDKNRPPLVPIFSLGIPGVDEGYPVNEELPVRPDPTSKTRIPDSPNLFVQAGVKILNRELDAAQKLCESQKNPGVGTSLEVTLPYDFTRECPKIVSSR